MKRFRWKVIICVLPVLLAAAVVARAWYQFQEGTGGFKLGVDLAGGTILVYEVDPDQKRPDYNINDLVAALKKRIDPADLYNITIRPVGTDRVEIILPTGSVRQVKAEEAAWKAFLAQVAAKWPPPAGKSYEEIATGHMGDLMARIREYHREAKPEDIDRFIQDFEKKNPRRYLSSERVQYTKDLIQRQGSLEFRILANERDDAPAIQAAKDTLARADKADLEIRARTGQPPPAPPGTYTSRDGTQYSYTWVEVGREERHTLGVDNAAENDPDRPQRRAAWKRAAEARDKRETVSVLGGCLLYSWPSRDKDKKIDYFLLTRDPEKDKAVTGEYLVDARSDIDAKLQPIVQFYFDNKGGNLFHELTSKNKPDGEEFHRHLAIVLDGQIQSAPVIKSAIREQGSISGIPDRKEVDTLVTILKAGRLPAKLRPEPASENSIGATLGDDTIRSGTTAVLLSFAAVMAFMVVYYRFAGLVACAALLANLLLTVAFMSMLNATFTLPGLAGLVLMLGMAVDANVLIYERVREERDRGASLALAIRNGYDRAFPTIIDTHLTSIFTAIVLYVVGNDQLKGFGVSLTLGLVISLFTSLYMTRVFFDYALAANWLTKLSMARLLTRPSINFMGIRYYVFTFTIVTAVLGVALFLFRGEKAWNIDFVGGTAYTGQLVEMRDIQTLRDLLDKQGERLKVLPLPEGVKQLDDPYTFQIVYDDGKDEDGKQKTDVRTVRLPSPSTPEEVRERASKLEDYSLQMSFLNSAEFSSGDKSRVFTVLTAEKAPQLVQVVVSRLLPDDLKRITLSYEITDPSTKVKTATLRFTDPRTGDVAHASPSQVAALLNTELRANDPKSEARQAVVQGEGKEVDKLFPQMRVTLPEPVDREVFGKVLEGLKNQFAGSPLPMRLENFDSQLAADTRLRAMWAILASWGAILLYLWFRFGNWTFGLAAVLCLIHDLSITLGAVAACHYIDRYVPGLAAVLGLQDFKLDLPAVASLLTLVGFSVNDTIVVFDRIREVRGKNPALTPQMINDSINQTLSRTILTSLTVWLVVIVLYIWGGSGVHLFAFVMVVGVLVGTFSSIYVASPLLLLFGEGKQPAGVRERPTQPAGTIA